jgi:hybrid cluster-associated redox disulfide protein
MEKAKEQSIIEKDMTIEEIVRKYPETRSTFERYGLGCVGCQAALFENIEQGAEVHGVDVDALIIDLNKQLQKD